MRTNIIIDDKLMAQALQITGLRTKKAVVEHGLKTLIQLSAQGNIRVLQGKVQWEGDLDEMRSNR